MRKSLWLLVVLFLVLAACSANIPTGTPTVVIVRAPGSVTPRPVFTAGPTLQVNPTLSTTRSSAAVSPGCSVISSLPPDKSEVDTLFGPVTDQDFVRGPFTATVTLLEYSDFQCAYCAALAPLLDQLVTDFPQDVRLVFRHYPLIGTQHQPIHDKAAISAQAAEAAAKQGKFWPMHDLLMSRQAEWSGMTVAQFEVWVTARAGELSLKADEFTADMNSPAVAAKVTSAWENGQKMGLPYAPYLVIDGTPFGNVPADYANFSSVISLILLEKRQYSSCPPITINPARLYAATLVTEKGAIVLELFPDKAPLAVNSFVFLARSGWYNNITFQSVIPGYAVQAGDPSGTGFGGPGYAFNTEIQPDLLFDRPGRLAMANAGGDTNGSQFFITYTAQPTFNGRFTIFGQVISGMDVLQKLTPRDPSIDNRLPPGDTIQTITIDEK